jgi:hypothetical protein
VAAGYLLGAEEDVEHQSLVVDLALVGNVDRVLDNAPVNPDPRYLFDIDRVIEEKAVEMPLGLERKGVVGNESCRRRRFFASFSKVKCRARSQSSTEPPVYPEKSRTNSRLTPAASQVGTGRK